MKPPASKIKPVARTVSYSVTGDKNISEKEKSANSPSVQKNETQKKAEKVDCPEKGAHSNAKKISDSEVAEDKSPPDNLQEYILSERFTEVEEDGWVHVPKIE